LPYSLLIVRMGKLHRVGNSSKLGRNWMLSQYTPWGLKIKYPYFY
jgi:hypothetical protein